MIIFTWNQETRTHNYNCNDVIIIRMEHSAGHLLLSHSDYFVCAEKENSHEIKGTTYQQVHPAESRLIGVFRFSCAAAAVRLLQNM